MAKEIKKTSKEQNKSVSEDLLQSVRKALYKLKGYLDNIDFTDEEANNDKQATTMMSIIEKMGKSFETLAVLEKKVASEELESTKRRGKETTALFED